ncbi:hypothetical protein FB107DRAFT_249254 [Schizophyllum commune]
MSSSSREKIKKRTARMRPSQPSLGSPMRPIRILSTGETLTTDKALQKEIDDRESTIQKQKRTIDDLSRRISAMQRVEAQLRQAKAEAHALREGRAKMTADIERMKRTIVTVKGHVNALKSLETEMNELVRIRRKESEQSTSDTLNASEAVACLRQELDKYESRLATVLDNATAAERMLERLSLVVVQALAGTRPVVSGRCLAVLCDNVDRGSSRLCVLVLTFIVFEFA